MFRTKAAMFGLDARIALAIFGALSVISGAALYSAIQNSKTVSVITDLNELGKAYDAYLLDTGTSPEIVLDATAINIHKLITDTATGWKGPYISYKKAGTIHSLDYPRVSSGSYSSYLYILEALDGAWPVTATLTTWNDSLNCETGTAGGNCAIWIGFNTKDKSLYDALDTYIDGSVDYTKGNFRYTVVPPGSYHVFYKYRPKQN